MTPAASIAVGAPSNVHDVIVFNMASLENERVEAFEVFLNKRYFPPPLWLPSMTTSLTPSSIIKPDAPAPEIVRTVVVSGLI